MNAPRLVGRRLNLADSGLYEAHEEGFSRMLEKMQPLEHVADPFERLKAMGLVYLEFAMNNKDFYDLMFIMQAPINHEKDMEDWQMGQRTLDYLKNVIKQCQLKGHFKKQNVEYLSFTIWSTVHGMSALYCRERCKAYQNIEPLDLIRNGHKIFVSMLERL